MKTSMCEERVFWKEFINLYKSIPALWDPKHEHYKDKETKDKYYTVLVDKMKTIDPDADQSTVSRKINILRTNFRRELNRVNAYNIQPTLWYFEDMMFMLGDNSVKKNPSAATSTSAIENERDEPEVDIYSDVRTYSDTEHTDNNQDYPQETKYQPFKRIKLRKSPKKTEKKCANDLNRAYWRKFIELYKGFPALWKRNSRDYKDRKLKEECYEVLINKLKEIEPKADRGMVRKKINTLRCNFRREESRIRRSQCSPKLWYFDSMMFLSKEDNSESESDAGLSDSEDEMDIKPYVENSDDPTGEMPIPDRIDTFSSQMDDTDCDSEDPIAAIAQPFSTSSAKMSGGEDEIDLQGKMWAAEFRKLSPEQQLFAKKAIDDILFERRLASIVRAKQ